MNHQNASASSASASIGKIPSPASNVSPRLDHWGIAPAAMQGMLALQAAVDATGLDKHLLHLVVLRVSQLNQCAYCMNMHTNEALADGESLQRLTMLAAWHETNLYTARERAALHWAEALTRLASGRVTDADFAIVRAEFSETETVALTLAVAAINGWNRFGAGFRPALDSVPGAVHA